MKLITFARMGKVGFGVVKENGIIDLTGRIHNDVSSIKDLLKLDLIEKAEEFVAEKRPEISISEITHLPVIPDPEKIFCIGLNYQEHKEETGRLMLKILLFYKICKFTNRTFATSIKT